MRKFNVTREQVLEQIEKDRKTKESLKASPFVKDEELGFYDERIAQNEKILVDGHGVFSTFRNEKVEIEII